MLEAKGQVQDAFISSAQSTLKNASHAALSAAWLLFKTQLQNDANLHRKALLNSQVNIAKKRQVSVEALKTAHNSAWDLINRTIDEEMPVMAFSNTKELSLCPATLFPWMNDALTALGNGMKRPETERVVYWVCLPVLGQIGVTSSKFQWVADFLTNALAQMPTTAIAVVLLGNRNSKTTETPSKKKSGT